MNHEARIKDLEKKIEWLENKLEWIKTSEPKWLSIPEASDKLGISSYLIRQLLPSLKKDKDYILVGKRYKISMLAVKNKLKLAV